ncbi:hypothetical protein D3C86_596650 [compost metagenome]
MTAMRKPGRLSLGLLALSLLIGCAADEDGLIGSGRRSTTSTPEATATSSADPNGGSATPTPKPTLKPTPKPTPTPWPSPTPTPTPTLAPLPDPVTGPSTGEIDPPPDSTESIGVD